MPSGSSGPVTPSEASEVTTVPDDESASTASTASGLQPAQTSPYSLYSRNVEEVLDYEKRIAFIQKQHEKMLSALHTEVEQLKRKNKGEWQTVLPDG